MCNNNKFYICEHCGNMIGMIHDAGVPMMCCGKKMTKLEPGVVEASHEKHIPLVNRASQIFISNTLSYRRQQSYFLKSLLFCAIKLRASSRLLAHSRIASWPDKPTGL